MSIYKEILFWALLESFIECFWQPLINTQIFPHTYNDFFFSYLAAVRGRQLQETREMEEEAGVSTAGSVIKKKCWKNNWYADLKWNWDNHNHNSERERTVRVEGRWRFGLYSISGRQHWKVRDRWITWYFHQSWETPFTLILSLHLINLVWCFW